VGSVGIVARGPLDEYRFNMFMRDLLAEKAKDIFRCKGVLAVHVSTHCGVYTEVRGAEAELARVVGCKQGLQDRIGRSGLGVGGCRLPCMSPMPIGAQLVCSGVST
jgi:hypothetical protein